MDQKIPIESTLRRSKQELIPVILELAKEGESKTALFMKAGMSQQQIRKYHPALLKAGLIEVRDGGKLYTTKKGLEALKHYKALQGLDLP
jgi:predicted transcriptional regulator